MVLLGLLADCLRREECPLSSGVALLFGSEDPFVVLWSVWKERNDMVFRGILMPRDDFMPLVTLRITKWESLISEFDVSLLMDFCIICVCESSQSTRWKKHD